MTAGPTKETLTRRIRTPASGFEGLAQEARVAKAIFHDSSESIEAEMNKIIILGDDLGTWTREVKSV